MEASQAIDAASRMRAALEAKDPAALEALLAPDVVLHSPIISTAFEGKPAVSELYAEIIAGYRDYRFIAQLEGDDGRRHLVAEGTLRGRRLETVVAVRENGDGLIDDITVLIRPLAGVIAFLVALGPPLARRRGRLHAIAIRLISPPLPLVAALVEWLAPKLVRTR